MKKRRRRISLLLAAVMLLALVLPLTAQAEAEQPVPKTEDAAERGGLSYTALDSEAAMPDGAAELTATVFPDHAADGAVQREVREAAVSSGSRAWPLFSVDYSQSWDGRWTVYVTPANSETAQEGINVAALRQEMQRQLGLELTAAISNDYYQYTELSDQDIVYTGVQLQFTNGQGLYGNAVLCVRGDVLGTGIAAFHQLTRMAQDLNGTRPLEGIFHQAADFTGSNRVNLEDLWREGCLLTGWDPAVVEPSSVIMSGPPAVKTGDVIEIVLRGTGSAVTGILQVEGLEFVSRGFNTACSPACFVLLPALETYLGDTATVTYTYRVTAPPGSPVNVRLSQVTSLASVSGEWNVTVSPSGAPSAAPTGGPSALPAPTVPVIDGYESGRVNGRNYYVKISGPSTMFYLPNSAGKLVRVAVPYVKDSSERRWYPINYGGMVLFPRLEDGRLTCYCMFRDGMEMPVLKVLAEAAPKLTDGYQTGMVGGRLYSAKVSGSSMMFYLPNSSGQLVRVAVPYVKDSSGRRWYPVNYGGTVLFPQLDKDAVSYMTGDGEAVLSAV